jgi:hypothetical protein
MTRKTFLSAYQNNLLEMYDWAQDTVKLNKFMGICEDTLKGDCQWNPDGDAARKAWRTIGCKGKMTLKGLRGLP